MAAIAMTRYLSASPGSVVSGILLAIFFGVAIGLFNGIFVAKVGINAFMMTLITQMFLDGVSLIVTGAKAIGELPEGYVSIGTGDIFGIPIPIALMVVFFILGVFCKQKFLTFAKIFPQTPVGNFYVNPRTSPPKYSFA